MDGGEEKNMRTVTLDLAFIPDEGTLPATAGIYLKCEMPSGSTYGPESLYMLTIDCRSIVELEEQADGLIREIEYLKKRARVLFQRSDEKWLAERQRSSESGAAKGGEGTNTGGDTKETK